MPDQIPLGVFYTCYTETKAVDYSLEILFKHYPDVPVYLVSDGGADYSFLKQKYPDKNIQIFLENDTRGKLPSIRDHNYMFPENQNYMIQSVYAFLDRVKRAVDYCNCKHLLIMEPDVLVRGKLNIPEKSNLLGTRLNVGITDEYKNFLSQYPGAVVIDTWGVTPAIFSTESFNKIIDIIKNNTQLVPTICKLEWKFYAYDVLFPCLFALIGIHEEFNPDIVECFRNTNWQNTHHPLLHQYRAKYPLKNDGYNGTHVINSNGLGDYWPWER